MLSLKELIRKCMAETGLSMAALAEKLGYRSKTSLERIMNANTRKDSLRSFEKAMQAAFPMSQAQKDSLSEAVESAVYGRQNVLTGRKILEFIRGEQPSEAERITSRDVGSGRMLDLGERYARAVDIEVTVLNCQYAPALFSLLRALFSRDDVCVKHYLDVDEDAVRTVAGVNMLMSVFYMKRYSGMACMKAGEGEATGSGLWGADAALFRYTDEAATPCEDVVVIRDAAAASLMALKGKSNAFEQLAGLDRRPFEPIKRTFFKCKAFEDYLQYTQDYAALERDNAVWKIKPDIGVDQIPVEIMKAALLRGGMLDGSDPRLQQTVDALEEIYQKRVDNTFTKKKHAYTIFKRNAMHRFVQTGKTSDHFWMMAPYTIDERIEILNQLLNQQLHNPYIHMYFLKENDAIRNIEIAYYEHAGMLFLPADTDYKLDDGHSEVLITHPEMLRLYRAFYMERLLKAYVLPESETCRWLREFIGEAMLMKREEAQ